MENNNETGTGYLTVRVTTARGAIPLEGATVTIRGGKAENSGVLAVLTTTPDGLTPPVALPAPPRSNSEKPDNGNPFAVYNLEVVADGYYNQYYSNIPAFDGIRAMQTVEMAALPENGVPDGFSYDNDRYFEIENSEL